jgi:flavin-dependent dehydrogenase
LSNEVMKPVLIVGGGPAGSAAAISLSRRGVNVLLFEAASGSGNKLVETLFPEAACSLKSLGVEDIEKQPLSVTYVGKDCNTRLKVSLSGAVWAIDRNRLDCSLRHSAVASGAILVAQRVDKCESLASGAIVHTRDRSYEGSHLIDASGKNAVTLIGNSSDQCSDVLDRRFNAFSHFERLTGFDIDDRTIVSLEDGFGYVLPIRTDRVCIGIVNYVAFGSAKIEEIYCDELRRCEFLTALTKDAHQVLPVIPAKNVETQNAPIANVHEHIFRVGDALGFRDPFLWDGLSFALETGAMAGQLCADVVTARHVSLSVYLDFVRSLDIQVRKQAADNYHSIIAQFKASMLIDPHVSPLIMGSLLSLTGGITSGGFATLRRKLNEREIRSEDI